MLPHLLTVFLIACFFLWSEDLRYGMSVEDVRTELGRPDSKMSLDSKELWIYADGSRIEFADGKLTEKRETTLTSPTTQTGSLELKSDPLIKAEDIVLGRENKTISASIQLEEIDLSNLPDSYVNSESLQGLQDALMDEQASSGSRSRIQAIASAFVIELAVTLLVLSIAFQLSGSSSVFRQLLLLSLAVAIIGLFLDLLIGANPLHPIRAVVGFIILLLLIRPLTYIRDWPAAIKIAVITRLGSMAIIWVIMLGLNMLMSL